ENNSNEIKKENKSNSNLEKTNTIDVKPNNTNVQGNRPAYNNNNPRPYNNYNKELNTNIELIKKANIKSKIDINDLSTSLYNVEIEVKSTLSNLNEVYYKTKEDKRNIEFELSNKEKELKKLKSNKLSYSDSVNDLINLLKTELESKYNKTIEVKPLCEYLKVLDPSWRNALEGYFNTQKFDIIVEPQYFDEATLLYKQYKDNLGIYDVGIVNVNKIMNDTKNKSIANDSLANKLEVSNDYAKSYVNYLLGNVICVNDISELKKHHIAITKECMVNKNYTIRAIHPRIYQKPFIGHDAIEIQIVALEATVDTLKTKLLKTNEDYEESKYKRELLMETNINTLISNTNKVTNYINIKIELDDITSRLNNLVVDPSVITLQEQLKSKEEERKQIDITIRQLEIKNHDLSNSNEQATKAITTIDEKLKELNEYKKTKTIELSASYNDIKRRTDEYLKDYLFNYSKILEEISIKISNINNNKSSYKFNVTQHMDEYNNLTNEGISSDLSSINLYISNYNKLKDIELSDFTNKAQQAKKKCEDSFQTSFISNLKTRIEDANAEIYDLNKSLKQNTFNGDTYEFVIKASSNSTYKDYYNIIMSKEDYNMQDLFMETLSEKNRIVMQELFDQIVNKEDSKDNQDKLEKYTDYRNYLSYDIKITHSNGDITMFSKVSSEKSGGETQIPYYVIIASSFQQIIKNNKRNDAGCLVLFDEAFNNMDESRIKTMMQFYKELSIQVMIAVPPERVPAIRPYIDQTLTVIKQNKQVMVREFNDETI
ncbi:MAG: SbcC/MukB-like Walker B domain-containing protein, partial [Erysipelotrichaceae bacterium]